MKDLLIDLIKILGGMVGVAAVVVALLYLGGCATIESAKQVAADHGSTAADTLVRDAKYVVCQSVPVGALERDLGGDPERIIAWGVWCGKQPTKIPLLAPAMAAQPTPTPQPVTPQVFIPVPPDNRPPHWGF